MITRFVRQHLSITPFEEVDLPNLTVLTGVNGSGKTHFLQAIQGQMISVEGVDPNSIITFNYETFRLDNESSFSAHDIRQEKQSAFNFFDQQIRANLRNYRTNLGINITPIQQRALDEQSPYWDFEGDQQFQAYKSQVIAYLGQPHMKGQQFTGAILNLIESSLGNIEEISRDEFEELYKPLVYKNDFLPQALGRVIFDYYVRFYHNEFSKYRNDTQGTTLPAQSAEEFARRMATNLGTCSTVS